ncbi:spore coat U domain-containing protein [Lysobacter sp. A6]|uniref:Spore coat U domain-containing protein n=1 Tax=Noviluteimonas lactosilytica TaxID=2888523 RepID=A0ABS8JDP6_9GAMM|nr:spore coat U domain-containing protein [Lysobacter lactosilyticus]MCC8361667.1 spore coat U domain-containing protein [Lysobacter lactosilyticus]
MRIALLALAVTGSMFAAASANAANANGNLNVTANVASSCMVSSPGSLAFGAYDPVDVNNTAPLNGAGTINVRCTRGTTTTIALEEGANPATGSNCTTPLRQMSNGTERLRYALFSDSTRTITWGCTQGTNTTSHTSTNSATAAVLDVWGRIPAGQDVAPGNYSDTVRILLTF